MQDDKPKYLSRIVSDDAFYFMEVLHVFSKKLEESFTEDEIFGLISSELGSGLDLEDCVVYRVDYATRTLLQVAAYGPKDEGESIKNQLLLKFGEGNAGIAAKEKRTIVIDDVTKSKDYIHDVVPMGSELEVPIVINNKSYAVISSESSKKNFFSEFHVKLFELVASIVAGAVHRLAEVKELDAIKIEMQGALEKKSMDVNLLLESLSEQYARLKYQQQKREQLTQEVHHRVNNNLQIISSMINLHLNYSDQNDNVCLKSIHNRVHAMALIHQNVYKSVELNKVDIEAYLRDLFNHIRSSLGDNLRIILEVQSEVKLVSLDSLVPIGILIVEFMDDLARIYNELNRDRINIKLEFILNQFQTLRLVIKHHDMQESLVSWNPVDESRISGVLCAALIDQLDGSISSLLQDDSFTLELIFNS